MGIASYNPAGVQTLLAVSGKWVLAVVKSVAHKCVAYPLAPRSGVDKSSVLHDIVVTPALAVADSRLLMLARSGGGGGRGGSLHDAQELVQLFNSKNVVHRVAESLSTQHCCVSAACRSISRPSNHIWEIFDGDAHIP